MVKNLKWCQMMEPSVPFECLLAYDTDTPANAIAEVEALANSYFSKVNKFCHGAPKMKTWPYAPNHAWQSVAFEVSMKYGQPWFWWESDAAPLRKGWINELWEEYKRGGKPFMGHVVKGVVPTGHINGVSIYPPKVSQYSSEAFLHLNKAWDVVLGRDVVGKALGHHAPHLIQHCWNLSKERAPTNGEGTCPSFANWGEIENTVDFRCVLFHRCKDGTLIDRLIEHSKTHQPKEYENVAQHTIDASAEIVQSNGKVSIKLIGGKVMEFDAGTPRNVQILIVTHAKDIPWLEYCLKSISKYADGISGLTIAAPKHEEAQFKELGRKSLFNLYLYQEYAGHGMMQHEEQICLADRICKNAEFVLHVDADCIFKEKFFWWDYVIDGKAVNVCRSYGSLCGEHRFDVETKGYSKLTEAQRKVVSDCYQWRYCVEKAIGISPEMYTMCRHPSCYPVWLYKDVRDRIKLTTKMNLHDFIMAQKNTFPQTFAEFPTLGGFAYHFHKDKLFWFDISESGPNGAPRDKLKAYWSHGGLSQKMPSGKTAEEEIKEFLK